jgi:DNA polymerase III epsilon subunit-like protein
MKQELKEIIRLVIMEGQIERNLLTIQQVIDKLKNRVLIFFDTETTGLNPRSPKVMITEIAAVAYDTSTGERLGQYSMKAKLNQNVLDAMEKQQAAADSGRPSPPGFMPIRDILKMTAYHEGDIPYEDEKKVLEGYSEFINGFAGRDPILVAHNAKFDMYQIGKALERHGLPKITRLPVLDTMALAGNYLHPMVVALEDLRPTDPEIERLYTNLNQRGKWVKRLGHLGSAFEVSTGHWHSAIADAEQLAGITAAIIKFFEGRSDTDVVGGRRKMLAAKSSRGARKPPVTKPKAS